MSEKIHVQVGVAGRNIPPGGDAGDILQKASDEDFDLQWTTPAGGSSANIPQPATSISPADIAGGAVGSGVAFARQDHQHPLNVASTGLPEADAAASRGTATTYARFDHVHPFNVPETGTPADLGTADLGSASTYARSDHVHQMPDAADIPSTVGDVQTDLTALYSRVQTEISGGLSLPTAGWVADATLTHTESEGLTVAISKATFESQISASGTYVYKYDGSNWKMNGATVFLADYGILVSGTPASGNEISVVYTIHNFAQTIAISDGSENTVIDLYPDYVTVNQMVADGTVSIYINNTVVSDAPVFTAIAVGGKPTADLTVAARRSELI